MDAPINVPVDNPNADTEWNDILRSHGIIPPKPPSPTAEIEAALTQARDLAHASRLEHKTLPELDALEDDEDESFLAAYRQQRLAELSTLAKSSIFGSVVHPQKPDYAREVTEASETHTVMVLLTGPGEASQLCSEVWRRLAERWGEVKFVEMEARMCIEGYPDRNTPTVLVYKEGDIARQIVTLKELRGLETGMREWEEVMVGVGAVERGDVRLLERDREERGGEEEEERRGGSLRFGRNTAADSKDGDEDDSDWE